MKASRIIAILVFIAVQILLFQFTWDWLVSVALEAGHRQRGGVAFGITVHYGTYLISFAFIIGSSVSAITSRPLIRWLTIGFLMLVWSVFAMPTIYSGYPNRGSAFYILGCLILVIGSGILVPVIGRSRLPN